MAEPRGWDSKGLPVGLQSVVKTRLQGLQHRYCNRALICGLWESVIVYMGHLRSI